MPPAPVGARALRAVVPLAALLPGAAFLSACKERTPPPRPTPVVSTRPATRGALPYVITANGEVEPNRTVAVQALVSGMLTRVAIAEGDEVRAGQVLFEVDPRPFAAELERARATLSRDEAQLARARTDSARYDGLARDGYVTREQFDQVLADVRALSATVAAGRAAVQRAQLDLDNATIRAPISGRTGQLAMRAGNLVRAQAEPPLVTINELQPVLVRFSIPERDFAELRRRAGLDRALAVRVTPAAGGDGAQAAEGTLAFVDNTVDRATGSVLLKARVANGDRRFWPGQFVTVGLELSVDRDAVTVPSEAVVTTGTGTYVYVVDDSSRARRVPVQVGRFAGAVAKIDSGLAGGEAVVVEGQNRLSDGAKVQRRGAGAPGGPGVREGGNAAGPGAADAAPRGGPTR
jgi:multidrug efflux system membrane fusion protein